MNILVTGSKGFIGKNLIESLKNLKDLKDRTRPNLIINDIYEYDVDSPEEILLEGCKNADFVFNLAGVNRPQNHDEFIEGNFGFASKLLDILKSFNNKCPVMLSSSIQATLEGKYNAPYGISKKAGENLFFDYSKEVGAKVLVYRFPNVFGKWCKPNYNSVVATFCHNIANDLPITVNDESTQLELVYIDDLVFELLNALEGKESRCIYDGLQPVFTDKGDFCAVTITHKVKLGEIVDLLHLYKSQKDTLIVPDIPDNSFSKKLYSTYLSYLRPEDAVTDCFTNFDDRGSFTEILKFGNCGQISVNVSKPGVTKGNHWHNTKWEFFVVVSGNGVIRQRKIGGSEVISYFVSGEKIQCVKMLPGYTHNIENLSETEDLITLMWANEHFDKNKPDTFFQEV